MARLKKPIDPNITIGRTAATARERLYLSQTQAAKRAGMSQSELSKLEAGANVTVSLGKRLTLAAVLNLSPDALVLPEHRNVLAALPDRPRATLLRSGAEPGAWTIEGPGIDGPRQIRGVDVGMILGGLLAQGIEVLVPAVPPVE